MNDGFCRRVGRDHDKDILAKGDAVLFSGFLVGCRMDLAYDDLAVELVRKSFVRKGH